ncbi:uncharacterized protein [Scyliorhinus torazame]|uniref:uncharacterized protein n=1 Tax=Scyliorhinus torazame TaxID=75743 RepID=UPI003B58ED6A
MVRDEELCSLGRMLPEKVVICGIQGERSSVPLCKVRLESPVKCGEVVVGVIEKLSCPGIQFILSNDIAGSQVGVMPTVVDKPVENQTTEVLKDEYPGIFPDCIVTRSQSHRLRQKEESKSEDEVEVQLSETIFDQKVEKEQEQVGDEADIFSSGKLAELQQKDVEIKRIYQKAYTEEESESIPQCYYRKSDVLMRKLRPVLMQADEKWAEVHQVVLPVGYRKEVLRVAHEVPVGGHLGIRKTQAKIQKHFYWPGLHQDVVKFCQSCHTCQVIGKPQAVIKPAPLIPIPAFEELFTRVLIDCVGPLPKTKSGNQYLLTTMDVSTRFPEAIPVRNITAKKIVEEILQFFTRYGLPTEIQSDQGSNFTSVIQKDCG